MCGIAGIFSFSSLVNKEEIKLMTDSLRHRGPDGEGCWINDAKTIGLGHRRLSIIDLSYAAAQPMHSIDNNYVIILNGEIYNYIELKDELKKKGCKFFSASDTEVLLNLYILEGPSCLTKIDGMFAFAIYDKRQNTLFCARDRFGEKPFFYTLYKGRFLFASEIKALIKAGVPQGINQQRMFEFLLYGLTSNTSNPDGTFYNDIFQLEPAHFLLIQNDGAINKQRYWKLKITEDKDINEQDAIERLKELFRISVNNRLRSDVPVGSSLSGGLDSSAIVFEINRIKNNSQIQKTYSARFPGFLRDEGVFIDKVVSLTNVEPVSIFPTVNSVFDNLKKVFYHQEIPFGGTAVSAQYEVMQAAHDNNTIVLLDGQGADEILAGYGIYKHTYLKELAKRNKKYFSQEKNTFINEHGWRKSELSIEEKLEYLPFLRNALFRNAIKKVKKLKPGYYKGISPALISAFANKTVPLESFDSLKEHLLFSTEQHGLEELLRYADRNAMAHSVETRLPFLSHDLVEFIFTLPSNLIIKNGWNKYILRKANVDALPEEIIWRKDKVAYATPYNNWFNDSRFINIFNEAASFLISQRIIKKQTTGMEWRYLMIFFMLNETFR